MGRWLQLDDKIINLDQVTLVATHWMKDYGEESFAGAQIAFVNSDCWVNTKKSVEEVYRLIEAVEGSEPPRALITEHDFDGILRGVYQCAICDRPKGAHAK